MRAGADESLSRDPGDFSGRWRPLRRELAWLLALKFAALLLIWLLFFSPAHRQAIDAEATSRRFGTSQLPSASHAGAKEPAPEEKAGD